MLRRRVLAALGCSAALALTACSGGGSGDGAKASPAEALEKAHHTLAAAKSVTFGLTSEGVPAGQNGVTGGDGQAEISASEPKFEGTVTGTVNGLTGNIPVVCVGDKAWWKLFTPDYTVADLASVNAPNPCTLFHPDNGIGTLLTATTDPTEKGRARAGKDVIVNYQGKLPGKPIQDLLHLGDGSGTYDVTFGVTENGELRQAVMSGPFFTGSTSTYTLTLADYGKAVTITPPQ